MITSSQIKAARALLGITATKLAELSGVAFTTIVRLESSEGIPSGQVKTLDAVQRAIEDAGIEFIGTPEEGAGVKWKSSFANK
ncbi:helix-turn-helix domain-containing protein [Polynucleobacter sp. IMCC30063]|uniref:helix-turn-helix domain-containing protein n=1 Tax=unclassified Polynucleobacter TaxID=2640945 RepID=UPI001F3B537C|nr:helix-turn-helix domain-containing protein [Polynucleobacter sp. IMCC30063]MCE7529089.1 helix-turn-helix domain-containing protein [Polynucleobacter sp. IMCC 29146]